MAKPSPSAAYAAATSPEGRGKPVSYAETDKIRRGDVGIAPYTHTTTESTNVGDILWTSREL